MSGSDNNTGATSAAAKGKSRSLGIDNLDQARKHLDEMNYLQDMEEPTESNLAFVIRQIAAQIGKISLAKSHAKALVAVALVLEEEAFKKLGDVIVARVEEKLAQLTTVPVTEKLTRISNRAVEETTRMEEKSKEVVDRIEKASEKLVNEVTSHMSQASQASQAVSGPRSLPGSYAHAAATFGPSQPSRTSSERPAQLDRQSIVEKQILVDFVRDGSLAPPKPLSPREWVTKSNAAIEAAFAEERVNTGASVQPLVLPKVVAATTLKNGGILLELDSKESATKVRAKQQCFANSLGAGWLIKEKAWSVKIKFVPVSTNIDRAGLIQQICMDSDIPEGSIIGLRWMRNPQNRESRQTVAHLIAKFNAPEPANKVLRDGAILNGQRLRAEMLEAEPMRCANCNSYEHLAAECKNHAACAVCSHAHRTAECGVRGDPTQYRCVNCKQGGHTAWDHSCPDYLRRLHNLRSGKIQYKFFVTTEDWTWEKRWESGGSFVRAGQLVGPPPLPRNRPTAQQRPPGSSPPVAGPSRSRGQTHNGPGAPAHNRETNLGGYGFNYGERQGFRWADEEFDFSGANRYY
jgi:hypothetical protein